LGLKLSTELSTTVDKLSFFDISRLKLVYLDTTGQKSHQFHANFTPVSHQFHTSFTPTKISTMSTMSNL